MWPEIRIKCSELKGQPRSLCCDLELIILIIIIIIIIIILIIIIIIIINFINERQCSPHKPRHYSQNASLSPQVKVTLSIPLL